MPNLFTICLKESEVTVDTDSDSDITTEETAIINRHRTRRRYYVLQQQIELGEMAGLYFTKLGRTFFYVSLCVYLYGDLAIYAAAVSKTISDLSCTAPDNSTNDFEQPCWKASSLLKIDVYRIFVTIFACLVCPFAYFNVQKTKYLQMLTSSMRWVAFTIMIALATMRLIRKGAQGHPGFVNLAGVPALLGASVYSFMCHHSLPSLIAPFANKQFVVRQLGLDYILICSFYLLLALTGSFAFKHIFDLYTLNFVPANFDTSSVFMECVQYFLGLFPLFTLSTSFPIIAITLQNNLKALVLDSQNTETYGFIVRKVTFPTLAVVPPIIVALYTHNLSSLVEFTGSYAGVVIQYIIPAFLVYSARRSCKRDLGTISGNKYASPFKHNFWIFFVICWSLLCIVFVSLHLSSHN